MNIVFIGCVEFSYRALQKVLTLPWLSVVGVVTRESTPQNADFHSLDPLAQAHGIPCLLADRVAEPEVAAWIRGRGAEAGFCFGWSRLLRRETLEAFPRGVVGYHPSLLPRGRGRHPIIWALALGLKKTGSSFFLMDEGADSGDLLSQRVVPIADEDDAGSLYDRLSTVAMVQLEEFTAAMADGSIRPIQQAHDQANYWRKRGKSDGLIDWRMGAETIHNLVRALTRPYPGAHCVLNGNECRVWKTRVLEAQADDLEPGKVLAVQGSTLDIQTGRGLIRLLEHELHPVPTVGTYL